MRDLKCAAAERLIGNIRVLGNSIHYDIPLGTPGEVIVKHNGYYYVQFSDLPALLKLERKFILLPLDRGNR